MLIKKSLAEIKLYLSSHQKKKKNNGKKFRKLKKGKFSISEGHLHDKMTFCITVEEETKTMKC